ncbi:uncharacterized protein [Branchiostoma lanceolatum]|uniref:uncharacterized protein n=1 Tax=Branchiostoma lanceolatum TaxID=7740 RepID=UPI00345732BF
MAAFDLALIKTTSDQEETKEPFRAEYASSGSTGTTVNLRGWDSLEDGADPSKVTQHPLCTLPPDPSHVPKARDPNPTYKHTAPTSNQTDTKNARNPNPVYPETHQLNIHPDPSAFSSGGDTPNNQPHAVTHPENPHDEPTFRPASNVDGNAGIQADARAAYPTDGESAPKASNNDIDLFVQPHAVAYLQDDDVTATSARSENVDVCRQECAATHQNNVETILRPSCSDINDDNLYIQPYAVRYHENDDDDNDNTIPSSDDAADENEQIDDIKPYAVAFMCPDDEEFLQHDRSSEEAQAKETLQNAKTVSNRSNDIPSRLAEGNLRPFERKRFPCASWVNNDDYSSNQNTLKPNQVFLPNAHKNEACGTFLQDDRCSEETQPKETLQNAKTVSSRSNDIPTGVSKGMSSRNDAYASIPNALRPNPMYLPNVHKEADFGDLGCTYRRMCVAAVTAAFLALLIFGWTFAGLFFNGSSQDTQMPISAVYTIHTPAGHPTCCGFGRTRRTDRKVMSTVTRLTLCQG